jgi:hypothetical protein
MHGSNSTNALHNDVNYRLLRAQFNRLPPAKQQEFIKMALHLISERTGMSLSDSRVEHRRRRDAAK